ncbi:hydroxymethylglutaryl-CoA lyase [Mesorhizobium sp. M0751]|uniref:hydroxymethylglutaryl-CoA lyase n=1 Tax=unclassified Mesorhizobium TaxID=325217 RepID=UPI00333B7D34
MGERALIFEVGPRDGLQNEPRLVSTADKIRLVDLLSQAGLRKIEVTSFVNPKWVPQMADAMDVLTGIERRTGVIYAALVPNRQGVDAALSAGADEIAVFASASESFSRRNINCSIGESLVRFHPVIQAAQDAKVPVRGYVSCVTDCPFEGPVSPSRVAGVVEGLLELGCYQISLGDTIGAGQPETVDRMLQAVLAETAPSMLAGHFHDTNGRALDNVDVCLDYGVRTFDAAVGGIGGCPFAPGAKGNVATEAVLQRLTERGFETDVDAIQLREAARFARSLREVA